MLIVEVDFNVVLYLYFGVVAGWNLCVCAF